MPDGTGFTVTSMCWTPLQKRPLFITKWWIQGYSKQISNLFSPTHLLYIPYIYLILPCLVFFQTNHVVSWVFLKDRTEKPQRLPLSTVLSSVKAPMRLYLFTHSCSSVLSTECWLAPNKYLRGCFAFFFPLLPCMLFNCASLPLFSQM